MTAGRLLSGTCVAVLAALSAATACAEERTAEVMHYWVSGGEAAAIRQVADAFKARGGRWVDTAIVGGDAEKQAGLSRIQGGNPPTAMMWNIGVDVTELAKQGLLNNVDDVARKGGWDKVLPPAVLQSMTHDGHTVAVPMNIHGENWLFANAAVLNDVGATMPKTWSEFFAAADKMKAKGYIPVAIGAQGWQEVIILRAVVAGMGTDFYRKVFVDRDPAAAASPRMKEAFETLLKIRSYADPGSTGRKWNDTTNLVITGKAGFQIMGDWAKGEFSAAGQTAGKEFACALPPGNSKGYIIAVDAFVFPKVDAAEKKQAQSLLAETMMDRDVQIAFNKAKGSVPVRRDIPASAFDACGQLAVETLADPANQLPNAALALTGDMEGGIEDLVTEFWTGSGADVDATVKRFAALIKSGS